jgi:hypothetical protein
VNANCELKRHTGEEEGDDGMDLADRPEPEGLNETDGHTGGSLEICENTGGTYTFSRVAVLSGAMDPGSGPETRI